MVKILLAILLVFSSITIQPANASGVQTAIEEIAMYLREEMKNRETKITYHYEGDTMVSDFDRLIEEVYSPTGVYNEGDYLRFNASSVSMNVEGYRRNGIYYLTYTFNATYYTNQQQEQLVDAKLDEIVYELDLYNKTDYEKISAIYDYITKNVRYDYEHLNDKNYGLQYTSYAALFNRTSVCQGYANLFYQLATKVGLDVRIIDGSSFGENHAWNIVKLKGKYYNLDATWDEGLQTYQWFLLGQDDFSDHVRNARCQTESFMQAHPMASTKYVHTISNWTDLATSSFDGGDGSQESPYQIANAKQLALLAKYVNLENQHYKQANYVLTNHIDLTGYEWIPIGGRTEDSGFYGVFDGNGYSISNMKITDDELDLYSYGLFGNVKGMVKNFTLKNPVIKFDNSQIGWQADNGMGTSLFIGSVAGELTNGTLLDVDVQNAQIDVSSQMGIDCGGAVGSINYATMANVIATGDIKATAARALEVGGCVGDISNETTIDGCGFEGSLYGTNLQATGQEGHYYLHYIGGFCGSAGRANGNISIMNCYAKADITSEVLNGLSDVGGFAGARGVVYNTGLFKNLYSASTIKQIIDNQQVENNSFWQGEKGFEIAENEDFISFENCVYIDVEENKAIVNNKEEYDLNEISYKQFFLDTLGFDTKVWDVRNNKYPTLTRDAIYLVDLDSDNMTNSFEFNLGDKIIFEEGEVKGYFNDGSTILIPLADCELVKSNNKKVGEQEVVLKYKGLYVAVWINILPSATLYGDINKDGSVNAEDRRILARTLANWDGYPMEDIDLAQADLNLDGKVNALDRLILTRHLAGWEGYETLPY